MIIKVCGMRETENIAHVLSLDIEMIGFIFYHRSPRFIGERILPETPNVERIGVFVDEKEETILDLVRKHGLNGVQLHGNESPDLCQRLREKGIRILKAIAIENGDDLKRTERYSSVVDLFVFDTKCVGYGGSGRSFNWSVLNLYNGMIPFLLSGGISAESMTELKNIAHPKWAGVDLNSGFEISPAMKNISQLSTFIQQIRNEL